MTNLFDISMQNLTLFISDLHLQAGQPQLTKLFLNFLKTQANRADTLYILGDFFEFWVGDDDADDFNKEIKSNLKWLSQQGVQVFFMPGNRDFLVGKHFAQETGCKLLLDPTVIDLYGTPTLLMHGDSLCTQDIKHQQFRRVSQHKITKKLFLMIPLSIRKFIANKIRNASKKNTYHLTAVQMDVWPETVAQVMLQHNVKQLIHGHTHRPGIHHFSLTQQNATRIVLGAWHDVGNALVCDPGNAPELVTLN